MMEHVTYMEAALAEARRAGELGEVPVGAIVVLGGTIIAAAGNRRETSADPTAHAEVLALRAAAAHLGDWRLEQTTLYVTQEPCPMCAGAILNARVPKVVYGCDNPKAGAVSSLYHLLEDVRLNHRCEVVSGVLSSECGNLLRTFFETLRAR